MDEFEEILQDFLIEAFELIEQLDQDLVELETRPDDLDLLNRIFRVAHTIKGASSFLNFDVLTHLTHHMENLLNMARHGDLIIEPNVMDVILESIDLMKALLVRIRDTREDGGLDVSACVVRLDAVANGESAPAPVFETPVVVPPVVTAVMDSEEELDYSTMSDAEVEAEIERLLVIKNAEAKAKHSAQLPVIEEETDYSGMSDDEVEAEIERLLVVKNAEAKAKRDAQNNIQEPSSVPVIVQAPVVQETPIATPAAPSTTPPPPPRAPRETKDDGEAKGSATVEQTIRVDVKRLDRRFVEDACLHGEGQLRVDSIN